MQSRYWCFTLNNPEQDEQLSIPYSFPEYVTYAVYQLERGENGTPHLQGYLECNGRVRLSKVRSIFGGHAHWETRRGTQAQAIAYCQKEETRLAGPWTTGEPVRTEQGKRNDLDALAELVYAGEPLDSIRIKFPGHSLRYASQIRESTREIRRRQHSKRSRRDLEVFVFWGDPGTGKTRSVIHEHGHANVFILNTATNGNVWFDGYEGESVLLIDDFRGWIKFNEVLKMTDIYPYRLPIKGSYDYAAWTKVYFTSNHPIDEWWRDDAHHCLAAFRRRLHRVVHFSSEHPWQPAVDLSDAGAPDAL